MKKIILITAVVFVFAAVMVTCTSKPPASPEVLPTAVVTPVPGADGYWSATTAGVTFKWKVNGANLDCKLSAPTTGWVAVGFNNKPYMDGANIIIGYVTGGTTAVISDCKGSGHTHPVDTIDNITNKAGTDDGTTTQLTFTIPMADDANGQDFALTQDGIYWLIMTNGSNNDDTTTATVMPANRGTMQIQLF
jgi:hypothetical protein